MQYFCREIDVRAIIDAVLKVRALERMNSDVSSSGFTLQLADAYRDWTAEFIDTIADLVERDQRVARRFASWRRSHTRRSFVRITAVRVFALRRREAPRPVVGMADARALPAAGDTRL